MRKRIKILLTLVLLAMVGSAVWGFLGKSEPRYQGKSISYWISQAGEEETANHHSGAGALPAFLNDSNAVPYLIKALGRQDRLLHGAYSWLYWHFPFGVEQRIPRPVCASEIRRMVAFQLGNIGPVARTAIPALLHALNGDKDIYVRIYAARTLLKLCKDDTVVVGAVLRSLNDKASGLTPTFINTFLWYAAPYDWQGSLPTIAKCLEDTDREVREAATNALSKTAAVARANARNSGTAR